MIGGPYTGRSVVAGRHHWIAVLFESPVCGVKGSGVVDEGGDRGFRPGSPSQAGDFGKCSAVTAI